MQNKTVLITGFFDFLHSGHIAFIQNASNYGKVYVSLGSDEIFQTKNRYPINSEHERKYMLEAIKGVEKVYFGKKGALSFSTHLTEIKPDYFIINEDGSNPEKKQLCEDVNVEYVVSKEQGQGLC